MLYIKKAVVFGVCAVIDISKVKSSITKQKLVNLLHFASPLLLMVEFQRGKIPHLGEPHRKKCHFYLGIARGGGFGGV